MQDKKKRNDLILVGVIVGVLLAFGAGLLLFRTEGDRVVVSVTGEQYGSYPLAKNAVIDIVTGKDGEQINRLVIKDGKAYVEYSNCDAIHGEACTKKKPIMYDGESIICRPHMVVIEIDAEK